MAMGLSAAHHAAASGGAGAAAAGPATAAGGAAARKRKTASSELSGAGGVQYNEYEHKQGEKKTKSGPFGSSAIGGQMNKQIEKNKQRDRF